MKKAGQWLYEPENATVLSEYEAANEKEDHDLRNKLVEAVLA